MSLWHSGSIRANGIDLFYTRTGTGRQTPIVLAHGFAESGRCWARVAEALADSYDVVMYDARGHGRSTAALAGYSSQERVADLAGLIGGLNLQQPVLVGHSMGAATVALLAAWHPQLPRGIVLEDPPFGPREPQRSPVKQQALLETWRARLRRNKARSRAELIARLRARNPGWAESELEPSAAALQELSLHILNILTAPGIAWQDLAPHIRCPTLVTIGDAAAGGIVTPETAAEMARLWHDLRIVHVPDSGHHIRREQFDAFMQALVNFLEKGGGQALPGP